MLKTPNCHQGKWILSTTFPLKFTENCLGHTFTANPNNDTYWQMMPCEGCSTHPRIYSGFVTWGEEASPACVHKESVLTSHLLSSCSVWVIPVEAFLYSFYLLVQSLSRATWLRGKGSRAWRARWPPENKEQMDLAVSIFYSNWI